MAIYYDYYETHVDCKPCMCRCAQSVAQCLNLDTFHTLAGLNRTGPVDCEREIELSGG